MKPGFRSHGDAMYFGAPPEEVVAVAWTEIVDATGEAETKPNPPTGEFDDSV